MPAPTIAELLAGDLIIKRLWAGILNTAFAGTGITAGVSFSSGTKSTPYVDVRIESSAATDRIHPYTVPGSDPPRIVNYNPVKMIGLVSTFCTTRSVDSDRQEYGVGIIRACAEDFAMLFNTDVLPYHGINLFKETGLKEYIDPDDRLDKTDVIHLLHTNIRSTAWELVA